MGKIFLDIGAHTGETLSVAIQPRWGFDRIYSFEPAPTCWPQLEQIADDRVTICRYGLWTEDTTMPLHDPGTIGASLFDTKRLTDATVNVELRDAASWFAGHVNADDEVIAKINCEGAECDLLDHLLAAGQLTKVDELVVHFDVRKVPGMEHREQQTRAKLDTAHVNYRSADTVFFGRNVTDKTVNWLNWYHATGVARLRYSWVNRVRFAVLVTAYNLKQRARHAS